jgi:hypothetical protein
MPYKKYLDWFFLDYWKKNIFLETNKNFKTFNKTMQKKNKKLIFGSIDLRIGFCRNSTLIELDRISALVEFLQKFHYT